MPNETMSTLTSNGNDALWSFEIIWSVISEQSPYWAVANEMHAGNVRTALELPREELQKAVGVLVKGRLRDLLIQARPYIESFASLSKHPTAPDDARNLVWQINEAIRSTHEVTAHETLPQRVFDLTAELRRYFESGTLNETSDLYLLLCEIEQMRGSQKASEPRELTLHDFGYAPGNYSIKCLDCGQEALWCDKRAARCKTCAEQAMRENRTNAVSEGEV